MRQFADLRFAEERGVNFLKDGPLVKNERISD